jgi:transcriptional coactivator p15 (PC4)
MPGDRNERAEDLVLMACERPGRGEYADEELRLSLGEYKGKRYLGLRLWFKGAQDGKMLPSKKGCIIRAGELDALRDALNRDDLKGLLNGDPLPKQTRASETESSDMIPF